MPKRSCVAAHNAALCVPGTWKAQSKCAAMLCIRGALHNTFNFKFRMMALSNVFHDSQSETSAAGLA